MASSAAPSPSSPTATAAMPGQAREPSTAIPSAEAGGSNPGGASLPELPWAFHDCPTDTLVILISHMLTLLMQHNDQVVLTSDALTRFHSRAAPGISVIDYLRRIVKYTNMEKIPLLSLLAYIDLTCSHLPTFTLSTLTVHRFLIAGVCAGSKAQCDVFCTNAHYAKVGGIKVQELNALEREFLRVTQWALCCNADLLQRYYTSLIRSHGGYNQAPAPGQSPFRAFPRSLSKPRAVDREPEGQEGDSDDGAEEDEDGESPGEEGGDNGDGGEGEGEGEGEGDSGAADDESMNGGEEQDAHRAGSNSGEGGAGYGTSAEANAGGERGRKARRKSVESVLGVSPKVMQSGGIGLQVSISGANDMGRNADDVDMERASGIQQGGTSAPVSDHRDEQARRDAPDPVQDEDAGGSSGPTHLAPPTNSSAPGSSSSLPHSPLSQQQALSFGSAQSSTSALPSSPASSSVPSSSRSSLRGIPHSHSRSSMNRSGHGHGPGHGRRGSSVSSRSVGSASVSGRGRAPSLTHSISSNSGRPADVVLDTREALGMEGVRSPEILGRQFEGRVQEQEIDQVGNAGMRAEGGATSTPMATVQGEVAARQGSGLAHGHGHVQGHGHGHGHGAAGGRLLKGLVGVFRKRPTTSGQPPNGAERSTLESSSDATSAGHNASSVQQISDRSTTGPDIKMDMNMDMDGRPTKSPRISQSNRSPYLQASSRGLGQSPRLSTIGTIGSTSGGVGGGNGVNANRVPPSDSTLDPRSASVSPETTVTSPSKTNISTSRNPAPTPASASASTAGRGRSPFLMPSSGNSRGGGSLRGRDEGVGGVAV